MARAAAPPGPPGWQAKARRELEAYAVDAERAAASAADEHRRAKHTADAAALRAAGDRILERHGAGEEAPDGN